MMTGNEIREKFLQYFESKTHTRVNSASLIPQNDPTLYFTNAGMVPFKNVFIGDEKRDYNRACSSQKCMRVSGKHNDLENVGRTARHHTFFEMLGNFSFGDYFKKDAIHFAWEFLTEVIGLPTDKLWITVFTDDDEAYDIWLKQEKIPADRIKRLGEKDNFWSMGPTGPCGPCSEIHYEQDIPCSLNNPKCALGTCDCDKYLEIWNLVFMQFNRDQEGKLTPLPKPSIDTGMGLERLTALLQNKNSNYDCDLFTPILSNIQKVVGKKYGENEEHDVSMRVIADHIRSTVFLINDGILPSNEGRGYVLRRIMRRAIRHGKLLGMTSAFFYRLIPCVIKEMSAAYPDLKANQKTIEKVTVSEEERFFETLEKGLKLLSEEISSHEKQGKKELSGEVAFKLYDTYGFPLDLTEIIAAENKLSVDQAGFDQSMTEQKERARAGWKGTGDAKVNALYSKIAEGFQTKFLGYETLEATATIQALIQEGKEVDVVTEGKCEIIFDQTPFYAESGGQIGDQGLLSLKDSQAQISDTLKPVEGLFVHHAKIKKGSFKKGDAVQLQVFREVRKPTMRNHTATHIMHAALRKVLGSHVRQAGSYVNDKQLRLDFSHFESITPEQLKQIEDEVNQVILANTKVLKEEMDQEAAKEKGALAFFGDKYGDVVRVISISDYSVEFCGGTHIDNTSEIGFFKILTESSIAAGVRRVEAVTGEAAIKLAQEESITIKTIADQLKAQPKELASKVDKLQKNLKAKDKEIEKLKAQLLRGGSVDYLKDSFEVGETKAVVFETEDAGAARDVADAIMEKLKSGISVVYAKAGPKATLVVSVSKDLTKQYQAGKILAPLAELISGRGGGKPERAQAGGSEHTSVEKLREKLQGIL
jgi:alanyl-tRNA synthetase